MGHGTRLPLRLLLVLDGRTIPRWLFKCLDEVERSGAAHIVLILQAGREEREPVTLAQRLRRCLFRLHQHLDRYLFRRVPDALAPMDLRSALPNRRILGGAELETHALREERIDVVLDPYSLVEDGCLTGLSAYGVWIITFGRSGDPRTQSTPSFWEVVEGIPSTETRLCIHGMGFDRTLSLYESVAPTDRRSVSRSQNHVYWKIAAALARKIRSLWEDPDAFLARLETAAPFDAAPSPSLAPGNGEMLRAWAVLVRRYVTDKWRTARYREQWALAFRQGAGDRVENGCLRRLMPPPDRFWADPFPVQVGHEYYVFHEELLFSTSKGAIVVTVLDDQGGTLARCVPVLESDCHFSYPFVFQWAGDFFMIPETASRHRVELYRCVEFPSRWKLERVLLSGVRAFDSTPAFLFGTWWLFANVAAYGAGSTDELHLFHADSPLGPWTPHRNNPVKSDVRSARPAGRIFESNGQLYRPAQDCSRHYGYAVSINRILRLDPHAYEEVEMHKILPDVGPEVAGVHTFNHVGNMTVIDCLVRSKRCLSPFS